MMSLLFLLINKNSQTLFPGKCKWSCGEQRFSPKQSGKVWSKFQCSCLQDLLPTSLYLDASIASLWLLHLDQSVFHHHLISPKAPFTHVVCMYVLPRQNTYAYKRKIKRNDTVDSTILDNYLVKLTL